MNLLGNHLLKEISGLEFNKLCGKMKLVKLTNETENHNGFQFQDGVNVDNVPFNPSGQCSKGGIYFIDSTAINRWRSYSNVGKMIYIRNVSIPDDARVYIEEEKFKTNKIILGPKMIIENYLEDPYYLEDPENLCFVKYKKSEYGSIRPYIDESLINEDILTKEICMIAVRRWYFALSHIPEHMRDIDICTEAFKQNIYALHYIPTDLKTKEICISALEKDHNLIKHIPEHLLTEDMYLRAILTNGESLKYVPNHMKDKNMCLIALNTYARAIEYIPETILDKEICIVALEKSTYIISYIPDRLMDKEMCMFVINKHDLYNPEICIQHIPIRLRDKDVCFAFVKKWGRLDQVPNQLWDRE